MNIKNIVVNSDSDHNIFQNVIRMERIYIFENIYIFLEYLHYEK